MARSKFPVEVLTPEGNVFEDEVEMVSTRTTTGSIGVLANHAPLMAILEPTELRLYKSESDVVRFAQGEGYLQVVDNSALVLVEEAIPPEEIDRGAFEARLREARDAVERAEEDSEERARAERAVRRSWRFGAGVERRRGSRREPARRAHQRARGRGAACGAADRGRSAGGRCRDQAGGGLRVVDRRARGPHRIGADLVRNRGARSGVGVESGRERGERPRLRNLGGARRDAGGAARERLAGARRSGGWGGGCRGFCGGFGLRWVGPFF